jgi:hypothetical protein
MIEQGRKRRVARLLVSGLAVAAVAGVAIAGTAVAHSRQSSRNTAVAGGPGTPTAVQTPEPVTPTVPPTLTTPTTPTLTTPRRATPTLVTPRAPRPITTPTPEAPPKPIPAKPQEHLPPTDPVAACKTWLKQVAAQRSDAAPGPSAKVVARLNGAPGTVLILADSNYWAGCDTAYARNGGEGSIRQPAKIANPAPGDAEAFTVANNLIPINGRQYEYYWAAGQLPAGVARIFYTFPDGQTTKAVIQGNYWLMQHQTATPWKEGTAQGQLIKVNLLDANGHSLRSFLLVWGEDTCAQISHGC